MSTHRPVRLLGAAFFAALFVWAFFGGVGQVSAEDIEPTEAEKEYAEALADAEDVEKALVKTVERVRRYSVSVANMREIKRGSGPKEMVTAGCGSGVLVDYKSKTWVLTNVHVIRGAQRLEIVMSDGSRHHVVEHDSIQRYDIALLRFAEKPKRRPKGVKVAASSEKTIKVGSWVIATGNPFFLAMEGASVVTVGVVSGLDRYLGGEFEYVGAIQHDAEVNPGNSGGPLWNLKGKLVGINGKIASRARMAGGSPTNTGASFSLPIGQVAAFLRQLVDKDEDAASAFLGLRTRTHTDKKGKASGAFVTDVDGRSPARRGKGAVTKGDVVTTLAVRGKSYKIYTADDLRDALSHLMAGVKVSVRFKRGRRSMTWSGVLAAR